MSLTEEVSNVMLEVAIFAHAVEKTTPDHILFNNEIKRMREEGQILFTKATRFDSNLHNNPVSGVPKYLIEDLRREIRLIRDNVISMRDMLSVTKAYASKGQNPSRYQLPYSSSEDYPSFSKSNNNNSSSTLVNTGDTRHYQPRVFPLHPRAPPQTPSTSSSSCSCLNCKGIGQPVNLLTVESCPSTPNFANTSISSIFPESLASSHSHSFSDVTSYPHTPLSSTSSHHY